MAQGNGESSCGPGEPHVPAAQEAMEARACGSLRREQPWGAAAAEACGASVMVSSTLAAQCRPMVASPGQGRLQERW